MLGDENNGRCYSIDGKLLYDGKFEMVNWETGETKPKGQYPTLYRSNKRFEPIYEGNNSWYLGETIDHIKHGWGLYFYPNGDCLYGEWRHGQKVGFGMKIIQNTCSIIKSDNWIGVDYKPKNME